MITTSLLTVLAGLGLYFYASQSFSLRWMGTGPGLGLTIGSLAALVAFFVGTFGIGPVSGKMAALGQKLAAAGGPPDPAALAEMNALDARLNTFEIIDITMLIISFVTMVTARFWNF